MGRIKTVKTISVSEDIWNDLKMMAKKQNRTASNMIEFLIELYKQKKI